MFGGAGVSPAVLRGDENAGIASRTLAPLNLPRIMMKNAD
jgi:hypothetical protein